MAHLSPKKGGFPFKDQHDRTCPVKIADLDNIERGIVLCVNGEGEFEIAGTDDNKANLTKMPLYLCLQDKDDLQAAMAGFFSVAKGDHLANTRVKITTAPLAEDGNPIQLHDGATQHKDFKRNTLAVTGILLDKDTWQLDTFDEDPADSAYTVNKGLTVNKGRFTPTDDDSKAVAYVVKGPYTRYMNDKVVIAGLMTGGHIRVIDIQGK